MKNQKESIRKMVTYLNNDEKDGGFWLPNIQRPFVWGEDQIERLFDSIMREYPISTLLVWKTKSSIRRRKFIDNYKESLKLTDFYVPEDEKIKLLVLDGQQRLQSLFIGLKGSYEKREMFFDVLSGNNSMPEDIRYRFKFLDPNIASFPWVKFKDIVFDMKSLTQMTKEIVSKTVTTPTDEERERMSENLERARQQFCTDDVLVYQELDGVDNPDIYREDDVVEIFIRANAGGTKLGKSELLFSLLTSRWEDADENLENLLEELNKSGYEFTRDFILKTCLTLLNKGARYEVSKFRDQVTREEIISKWSDISNAIKDVRDFLFGKTFLRTDRALPSYLSLIPLIYFRYHFSNRWKSVQGVDSYLLRTLITGAFSGTPDNLIDKCTKNIAEIGDFDLKQIFGIIRADGRNLEITKDTLLNQRYGSKNIHLIFNIWYKDFNYSPSYSNNLPQVDHIFPQSLLRSVKDENPHTNRKDILHYKTRERDQIANCMLLTAEENGSAGKTDIHPDSWFRDKSLEYLEMHLIPQDRELWKLENFPKFIEARKVLIAEQFKYMMQAEM